MNVICVRGKEGVGDATLINDIKGEGGGSSVSF